MRYASLFFVLISSVIYAQKNDFTEINLKKADSIARYYENESLENLPLLSYKLTHNLLTDAEKFRAIYTWVCLNIESDYWAYLKNKKKRKKIKNNSFDLAEWNNLFLQKIFKTLLEKKQTVCTGYAYLIKELAYFAGIKCELINGFGKTANSKLDKNIPNHSWNAVFLNEKWYLCDATWSSGYFNIDSKSFVKDFNDGYFLALPELFTFTHYPLDTKWTLSNQRVTFSEFLEFPILYKYAFEYQIVPRKPTKMHLKITRGESIDFKFLLLDSLKNERIELESSSKGKSQRIIPMVIKNKDSLTLRHTFQKIENLDIHIKVDGKYVASYVVSVERNN